MLEDETDSDLPEDDVQESLQEKKKQCIQHARSKQS